MTTSNGNKLILGQYATPKPVAEAIVTWAVDGNDPQVLDPSFGGCVFVESAFKTLRNLGFGDYLTRVHGTDIDPDAVTHLTPFISSGAPRHHFHTSDFFDFSLTVAPQGGFSAVVGNPPYVRSHVLREDLRQKAQNRIQSEGFSVSNTASYWAYFVLHSLTLLRKSGCLGMVLPGAFLHAEYARPVRERVFADFEEVRVVLIGERIFRDAEEEAILLLARGWGNKNRVLQVARLDSIRNIGDLNSIGAVPVLTKEDGSPAILASLVGQEILRLYDSLLRNPDVVSLGSLAKTRIGIVTGCNKFFIRRPSYFRSRESLARLTKMIVTSSSSFAGIEFSRRDLDDLMTADKPCFLVCLPKEGELSSEAQRFIQEGTDNHLHTRYKCANRKPWYLVSISDPPDAFLTYMSGYAPRVIINSARVISTNAIHQLVPRDGNEVFDPPRLALGSLTTLFQFSAELNARSYGGGVLKVEPSEADRLRIPLPGLVNVEPRFVSEVDSVVRTSGIRVATQMVDEEWLSKKMGLPRQALLDLRSACDFLRTRRTSRRYRNLGEPSQLAGRKSS